ncbi:GNAT family N-acetyltransferase [Bacillus sp. AGMB 02131]|uniref:GNAT family N-acetyltransferase n=1 Tax=Peribacillus faecalis TaxID=2772559 RepID=A0A927HDL4_9BACI|nr:GNAT family N-acetyltransferase [Peribacillus faecalis]MBD3109583.1 GNAT family N-acetyltransferase [Peribacillus faecalis]
MIRKATRDDRAQAAVLIYDAIHDIANALTGETEDPKVLQQLEAFYCQEMNRLSYHNCLVKSVDNQAVGIVIAYHGKDAQQLDEPIVEHLKGKNSGCEPVIDQEADEDDFYIDTVSVNPQFSGRGFGTELLNAAVDWACQLGYSTVSLNVEENNFNARRLYERLGFEYEKEIMINNHVYAYLVKRI